MEDNVVDIDLDMLENDTVYTTTEVTTQVATGTINKESTINNTPNYDNLDTRPEAIYLLGLDNMSTNDIQAYCQETALKKIEWIDDSSCVLVYENEEEAKKATQLLISESGSTPSDLQLNTKTLYKAKPFIRSNYDLKKEEEKKDDENKKEEENNKEEDEEMDNTRPPLIPIIDQLQIRMATDKDIKIRGSRERSRYYLFHGTEDSDVKEKKNHHRHHPYERNQHHHHHHHHHHHNDKYSSRRNRHRSSRNRRSLSPNHHSKLDDDKPIEIPERLRGRLGKLS
ncbi:unnamed protein product [Cunninghamella blakesleeana]